VSLSWLLSVLPAAPLMRGVIRWTERALLVSPRQAALALHDALIATLQSVIPGRLARRRSK
jgi:hypothetical protein